MKNTVKGNSDVAETTLEIMRAELNSVNERLVNTNKKLEEKLVYLRGSKPKEEENTKREQAEGFLFETKQTIDFMDLNSIETSRLLSELFELI